MKFTAYEYDAYISHAETDRAWVEQFLIPRLVEADLKYCIDFEHFKLGAIALDEVERSITVSRKILLIISSDYLKNNLAVFESRFARFLDPSASEGRSIPVIISPCRLSNTIKQLVKVDLSVSSISERGKEWDRLINCLKSNPVEIISEGPIKTKKTNYPLLTKMERELRMKKYHWIKAGFSIPAENFNFAAVYFDNQLEVLQQLQYRIELLIDFMQNKRVNPSHPKFLDEAYEMIDEIDVRTTQIDEVLKYEKDHTLSIYAQKANGNFSLNSDIFRKLLIESSVHGILEPNEITELSRGLTLQLRTLAISGQELQKHLREIYNFANVVISIE